MRNAAFERGVKDCADGKSLSDNPYSQDFNAAANWREGFTSEVERCLINNNRRRIGLKEITR